MLRFSLLAVACLGAAGAVCASDFSFGRPVRLTLAFDSASSVAIGDFDGDGRDDLAAAGSLEDATHEVLLFRQGNDARLESPLRRLLPYASNAFTTPVAMLDLDHDGRDEVVVGISGGVEVVRPDGSGGLVATAYTQQFAECRFMDVGDIEGDGHPDVACHDWKETAWLFHGDGAGGFHAAKKLRTPMGSYDFIPKQVRLADVTGDGRDDLLVTASDITSFSVFANNGLGGFWPARVYVHPYSYSNVWPVGLEVMDLDGDGVAEVVTASPELAPAAMLNVYRLQGNGFLGLSERIPSHHSPTALLAADIDRDGDEELLAGHFSFAAVTLFGANAQGLAGPVRIELPGFGNHIPFDRRQGFRNGLALGDLDHDGCPDMAAATYSGVVVLPGCRTNRRALPVSDYDGDGVSDLMFRVPTAEVMFWAGGGVKNWYACLYAMLVKTGNAMCPPRSQPGDWLPQAHGDFDGDGTSDQFWRHAGTGANQVWDRGFYPRDITGVASRAWQVLGAGDFDGDDRSDLFWRNASTGANRIWKSADSSRAQAAGTVKDQRWRLAGIGDFNGDGRSDLLWRHAANGRNVVWWSASPASQKGLPTVDDLAWTVAGVGDFNADGRDDVVWRNTATGANSAWLSASSSTQMAIKAVRDLGWGVAAVGDYDGDGRADLMWRHADGRNTIWRSADSRKVQEVAAMEPLVEVVR